MFEKKLLKSLGAALCMAMMLSWPQMQAQALGFGVPVLNSHLDEVLDVRVPIILGEHESLNHAFVELAKPDEYRQLGLQPYMNMSSLRLSVNRDDKLNAYAELASVSVMKMPVISLLLKVRYERNQYYKHIQLILDPIESIYHQTALKPANYTSQSSPSGVAVAAIIPPQVNPVVNIDDGTVVRHLEQVKEGWARTWRYGPVRSGDSLSTIAYRLRKDKQWSNLDVMLALYRNNPDAFINADMNRLKSGGWLDVPKTEQLLRLLHQKATASELKHQWKKKFHTKKSKDKQVKAGTASQSESEKLHFVGRIGLGKGKTDSLIKPAALDVPIAAMKGQLDKLYEKAMASHIQMGKIDQSLQSLNHDMQQLKLDMTEIKHNQQQALLHSNVENNNHYWMFGFLLLLLTNLLILAVFLYRHLYPPRENPMLENKLTMGRVEAENFHDDDVVDTHSDEQDDVPTRTLPSLAESLDAKVHDIESALELGEYQIAEQIIEHLVPKQREHFRMCGLRARLYHETSRFVERDELIAQKRESLSKEKWNLLCGQLPLDLWNALHAAKVIPSNGHADISPIEEKNLKDNEVALKKDVLSKTDDVVLETTDDGLHFDFGHQLEVSDDILAMEPMDDDSKEPLPYQKNIQQLPDESFLELGEIEWTPTTGGEEKTLETSENSTLETDFTSTVQCMTDDLNKPKSS